MLWRDSGVVKRLCDGIEKSNGGNGRDNVWKWEVVVMVRLG